jgi:hypothetical protein
MENLEINKVKVENMRSTRTGKEVSNQFIIRTDKGIYFQSYKSIIAFIPYFEPFNVLLDEVYYNYSRTTAKYRNLFLNLTSKEIEELIKKGDYKLVDLNEVLK